MVLAIQKFQEYIKRYNNQKDFKYFPPLRSRIKKKITSAWFDENSSTIRNDCSYETQVLYFNSSVTRNIHGDISF